MTATPAHRIPAAERATRPMGTPAPLVVLRDVFRPDGAHVSTITRPWRLTYAEAWRYVARCTADAVADGATVEGPALVQYDGTDGALVRWTVQRADGPRALDRFAPVVLDGSDVFAYGTRVVH